MSIISGKDRAELIELLESGDFHGPDELADAILKRMDQLAKRYYRVRQLRPVPADDLPTTARRLVKALEAGGYAWWAHESAAAAITPQGADANYVVTTVVRAQRSTGAGYDYVAARWENGKYAEGHVWSGRQVTAALPWNDFMRAVTDSNTEETP